MSQDDLWRNPRGGAGEMASTRHDHETVVVQPLWLRTVVWLGLPVLGTGAGWLLRSVAGWVASLPWAPFQGPFELADRLIASFGEPQATVGALALGAAAGLVLALIAEQERLTVTVSDDRVATRRGGSSLEISHAEVAAVFLDGKQLVVLGKGTTELARIPSDLDAGRLGAAFLRHGYPWSAGDPHQDDYRLWVAGTPDLPVSANALLRARERVLGKDDGKEDATILRAELAKLGVVVREEKRRQYWRRTAERQSDRD